VVYKGRKKKTIEYVAIKSVRKGERDRVLREVRALPVRHGEARAPWPPQNGPPRTLPPAGQVFARLQAPARPGLPRVVRPACALRLLARARARRHGQ
jgi:hypothetical protein